MASRWALPLLLLALACGKQRVHEVAGQPWEPATLANGYQAVVPRACPLIDAAGKIHDTTSGSIQDVLANVTPDVIGSDERAIYWASGSAIHRTERASSPWPEPWHDELLVMADLSIVDLAVTRAHVYFMGEAADHTKTLFRFERDAKPVFTQTVATGITGAISKLVARGSSLVYATNGESIELEDSGSRWPLPSGPNEHPVLAVDERAIYTYTAGHISVVPRRHPWTMAQPVVAIPRPVDLASDGVFLYWLEEGEATPDCERCSTAYSAAGRPTEHGNGKLRRVPIAGGTPTDLFTGLPNVEALTSTKGVLWISTAQGLLRYDPSCHLPPARVAGQAGLHGRAAPFGEALAVLGSAPKPRVVLLGLP